MVLLKAELQKFFQPLPVDSMRERRVMMYFAVLRLQRIDEELRHVVEALSPRTHGC